MSYRIEESKCVPYGLQVTFITPDFWSAKEDFSPDGKYGRIGVNALLFTRMTPIVSEAEAEAEAERLYMENYSMSGFHWVYYAKGLKIFRARKGQTAWGETNNLHDEEYVSSEKEEVKKMSVSEIKEKYSETYKEMKNLENKYKGIYFIES
jgi:hypothetical protein